MSLKLCNSIPARFDISIKQLLLEMKPCIQFSKFNLYLPVKLNLEFKNSNSCKARDDLPDCVWKPETSLFRKEEL